MSTEESTGDQLSDWWPDVVIPFTPQSFLVDDAAYGAPSDSDRHQVIGSTGDDPWRGNETCDDLQPLVEGSVYHAPQPTSELPTTVVPAASPRPSNAETGAQNAFHSKKRRRDKVDRAINQAGDTVDIGHNHPLQGHQQQPAAGPKRTATGKRTQQGSKTGGAAATAATVRWAEQVLYPCAQAIDAGVSDRVQHHLVVLHELGSLSGDANHRLADYGLRAIMHHLSSTGFTSAPAGGGRGSGGLHAAAPQTFVDGEPRMFRETLMRFQETSPWFALPNSLANASILQTALNPAAGRRQGSLHIVDAGISHGMQWPTLLEPLARRGPGGGSPPSVLITVAEGLPPTPFSDAPKGDDFAPHLLRYARILELSLRIERQHYSIALAPPPPPPLVDQNTGALNNVIETNGGDDDAKPTLVVCAQFRLHQLTHSHHHQNGGRGERDAVLDSIRRMQPDLVVLTETDGADGCCCCDGGTFAPGFARRVDFLWKFLDSTSAAFKGRDSEERRLMEGEAARALLEECGVAAAGDRRESWFEAMAAAGFQAESFGEEALDGGRALLRKYDGNWEMRPVEVEDGAGVSCVCLCWKGLPVSFCSLWKPALS